MTVMKYIKTDKLYCFSPPVMMATFLIEISLMVYTLWRYKMSSVTKVSAAILGCLAMFQLAEYNVCEGTVLFDSAGWARLGYAAITLLPPLGIHLVNRISNDKTRWPVVSGYAVGGLFAAYFLFMTGGIAAGACLGNYVIFEQQPGAAMWYGLYYYGLLMFGIIYALQRAGNAPRHIKQALRALVVGYVLFMVPTTFANIVSPTTISGIPSIMCGFAVLLALAIAGRVLPYYHEEVSIFERVRGTLSNALPFNRKIRS